LGLLRGKEDLEEEGRIGQSTGSAGKARIQLKLSRGGIGRREWCRGSNRYEIKSARGAGRQRIGKKRNQRGVDKVAVAIDQRGRGLSQGRP